MTLRERVVELRNKYVKRNEVLSNMIEHWMDAEEKQEHESNRIFIRELEEVLKDD